jgi:antitoxin CptB
MTGARRSSADLDVRMRKLLFRSWHRGMREVDLILGTFADGEIDKLSAEELLEYEGLLEVPDGDLLAWVTGEKVVPTSHDTALFRKIVASRRSMTF